MFYIENVVVDWASYDQSKLAIPGHRNGTTRPGPHSLGSRKVTTRPGVEVSHNMACVRSSYGMHRLLRYTPSYGMHQLLRYTPSYDWLLAIQPASQPASQLVSHEMAVGACLRGPCAFEMTARAPFEATVHSK